MDTTPNYTDHKTRDPRNPPIEPEEAEKMQKAAKKRVEERSP